MLAGTSRVQLDTFACNRELFSRSRVGLVGVLLRALERIAQLTCASVVVGFVRLPRREASPVMVILREHRRQARA